MNPPNPPPRNAELHSAVSPIFNRPRPCSSVCVRAGPCQSLLPGHSRFPHPPLELGFWNFFGTWCFSGPWNLELLMRSALVSGASPALSPRFPSSAKHPTLIPCPRNFQHASPMNNFEISNLKSEILPADCSTGNAALGRIVTLILAALFLSLMPAALAQSTAFTYQGRLNEGNSSANGTYEMRVMLFSAPSNGLPASKPILVSPVPVSNGLFTVLLDFGPNTFDGTPLWLEVSVAPIGSEELITLSPRQPVMPAPYAMFASESATTRSIRNPAFLGTTDNSPLEFHVHNRRALRLEPTAEDTDHSGIVNVISGSEGNFVSPGVYGATIAGGGGINYFEDFVANVVSNDFATIGGGSRNTSAGDGATIGGGFRNTATGSSATIGGGARNSSTARIATVAGGLFNASSADGATVAGGQANISSGTFSAVGGGENNQSQGRASVVPGGGGNLASGDNSFAAGQQAQALHHGAFVWSDSAIGPFASTTSNQFSVRASGGVRLETAGAGLTLDGQTVLSGPITSSQIADGVITSAKLAPGSVTAAAIQPGSITADAFAKTMNRLNTNNPVIITNPVGAHYDFAESISPLGHDRLVVQGRTGDTVDAYALFIFHLDGFFQNSFPIPQVFTGDPFAVLAENILAVAAPGWSSPLTNCGAVRLYNPDGALIRTILHPTPREFGLFSGLGGVHALGSDKFVAVSGNHPLISRLGEAHVFHVSGNLLGVITNPVPALDDLFGYTAAALGNDKILIGAPGADVGLTNAGAAYVFDFQGNLLVTITNPAPNTGTGFGYPVIALGGTRFAIGAGAAEGGAVYIYASDGTPIRTITPPEPSANYFFGSKISAVGSDRLAVSVQNGGNPVYLYNLSGQLIETLRKPYTDFGTLFGFQVKLAGGSKIVVADPGTNKVIIYSPMDYVANLVPEAVRPNSIGTAELIDQSITAAKLADGQGSGLDADLLDGLSSSSFWNIHGNASINNGFLGTLDLHPLEFRVNNQRALRLDPTDDGSDSDSVPDGAPNFVGGASLNFVLAGIVGATISGGGATNYSGFMMTNSVHSDYGVVGGGLGNSIDERSLGSVVAGGRLNSIHTNSGQATISGGENNAIGYLSSHTTIAGGFFNDIDEISFYAAIGGGNRNKIGARCGAATIAGGWMNEIGTNSFSSAVGGGEDNRIGALSRFVTIAGGGTNSVGGNSGFAAVGGGNGNDIGTNSAFSTIGGGQANHIGANAPYATIAGGDRNFATNRAFAAGTRAKANHSGAFVWSDTNNLDVVSTNANSVTMRAAGGYRLFSNSAATQGAYLASGSSTWTTVSDRNAKENFEPVNARAVLDKVAALPVSTWNYKAQTNSIRHIGPMAQDFKAAFDVGESNIGITTVDADGVALAAIQGLNQKLQDELRRRDAENADLKERLAKLEKLFAHFSSSQKE